MIVDFNIQLQTMKKNGNTLQIHKYVLYHELNEKVLNLNATKMSNIFFF